jgi:hypothetical protein
MSEEAADTNAPIPVVIVEPAKPEISDEEREVNEAMAYCVRSF